MNALYIAVVMFCFACAATKPLVSLPIESGALEEAKETEGAEETEATWGDDFAWSDRTYMACIADRASSFCEELDSTRSQVESIVNPTLKNEQELRIGSRIDNLVFVEIFTPCPPHPLFGDCDMHHYARAAVILGKNPRIVELPNEELFVHFMKNIRKTPHVLELETIIRTTLILLTGNRDFVVSFIDTPDQMPCSDELILIRGCRDDLILKNTTWMDKDGVLVIHYMMSIRYECRLRVEADQKAMRRCVSPVPYAECFMEHFFVPDKETRRGCDNEADMPVELWVDESKRGFVHSVLPE
ncbi:MAG: hypothetical protein FWC40_00240 [Proteobacteria bacterium]|nr:hypothetical protein [Pseudomonadota bacterium]